MTTMAPARPGRVGLDPRPIALLLGAQTLIALIAALAVIRIWP